MSRPLRQSTGQTEAIGPFLDKDDGVTEETGLGSPATEISKDGAAFGTGPTGTHDAEGWYHVGFTSAHTDTLGSLMIKSQAAATHLPVWHEFEVLTANEYDSKFGTDIKQADVTQWLGTAAATPTVAGVPEVDVTHADGVSGAVSEIAAGIGPKINQAFSDIPFLMVLSSDGQTPATGLTVTGERSLDGGSYVGVAGAIAEISDGYYQFDASAADMNGATIIFRFSSATALDTGVTIKTTPA